MNQKTSTLKIEELLSFPNSGDIVSGVKVSSAKCKVKNGKLSYRVCLPKGTRRADVPNILRSFYTTGLIVIDGVDTVVKDHNYRIKPTRTQTIVTGSASVIPLSLTNPGMKQLTAMEDFDQEYSKMEMAEPGTYFRIFPYRGFDGPAFRTKLFSFVSKMGENYGYCDDKKLYHRRASLVMPKIKITKAPPDAKMFYHTHPKKDEPSLSSADDYLVYFDMSHKPLNIRHFYTVMADRMDYFHIVPKHSKKKDYVKINEDKFIEEVDNQIDEAGKRLDEKLPSETYEDNLYYCERVTREVVKFLNKKYSKYFTITYKCHYRVKKNPDKPTGSDLHLDDEFIAKGLNDIKSGKYSWPEFNTNKQPQEEYAYWHSRYFSLNRDARGVGYTGLMPGDMRRLEVFLYDQYRGSNYTYDDILGILCLSYDIRMRDSKIRDGKRNDSKINEILDFLEVTDQVIRDDIVLMDSIVSTSPYGELSEAIGTHRFVIPLADFSMKSIEAMKDVRKGKKDLNMAKYEINVKLKERMANAVAKSLGEANEDLRKTEYGEPDPETGEPTIIKEPRTVPVYGIDGVVQKDRVNPPIQYAKTEFKAFLPVEIFDNPDLIKEIFEKFKKEGAPVMNANNTYTISVPANDTAVSMLIQPSTGNVQMHYPSKGFQRTMEPTEAVVSAFRTLVETLTDRGFRIRTDDIAIGTAEPIRNPNDGMIISISGPVQSTKTKILDSLEKRLDGEIVRTYTTKTLKEYEKRSNLVEVSEEIFANMANNGDLVVVTNSIDGDRRGYLRKDFLKAKYLLLDSQPADLPFLLQTNPGVMSFYLQPTNTEAEIKKVLMEDVSPQEAKRVAELASDKDHDIQVEVDYLISYDVESPAEALEEVFQSIPKKNPGPRGSVFFPGNGSNYYLTAKTIPITALQGEPYRNPGNHGCPLVTQDLEMNTRNRNSAIQADYIQYGPLNLADEEYWVKAAEHWKTTVDVAKESNCSNCVAFDISPRMLECMPGSVQEDGQLGMCWMHNFKCHSARTCYTWAAGGPITEDSVSYDWQERSSKPKENPKKKIQIRIQESTNPEKKLMAIFTKPNGKTKTTHFGARGMSDYTQHKDPKRQKSYLARHGKMGEDWNNPTTAGALSRWILWGKPSLRESFNDFKKRFNLEGVMAVSNTKMNPPFTYDLMSTVKPIQLKRIDQRLFPKKMKNWDKKSDKQQERLIQKSKEFRRDLEYAYGWKGKTAKTAAEAILADFAKSFDKNGYVKVYRGLITLPSEDLSDVWDKYGVGQSWSTYKEGADDYMRTPIANTPGAVLVLVEGRVHVEDLSPTEHQLSLRIAFPLEKEIEINDRVEVIKYSMWRIDPEDRVKKPKWETTGKNWKPWLRQGIKPISVVEVNQTFPAYTPESDSTSLPNPNQDYYAIIDGKPVYPTESNPRIPKKYEGQDPSEHSDLYTDEDPEGTIQGLGFKDAETAKKSIQLIKKSGKTHAHKIQAAMAMEQRARFHPNATKGIKEAQKIYAAFIEEMKKKTKRNPSHCPVEVEARRAANDPSFKHHKWYVKHHLDYVMAIAKAIVKSNEPEDQQLIHDMVWMHDYPKMLGDKDNFELVREFMYKHRSERYTNRLMNQLRWMEEIKSPDWSGKTTTIAAVMSVADALAHYYGPFFQIYIDENPDMSMEEIKKSNRQKLAKDKLKLRAGPMKDGLDSIKFQYKGRKVKIVGNEQIKELIEKKNPSKTPEGRKIPKKYLKGLNKEEMAIAAKEIDKGYKYDIDDPEAYEYWKSDIQATARGYKTVPSKYKKKFIQMYGPLPEEGKFLDKMAKATKIKKSILEKVYDKGLAAWRGGHRPGVQQHQWAAGRVYSFVTLGNTVKKGNKKMPDYSLAIKAGLIKENPSWRHGEFAEDDPFEDEFQ